MSTPDFVEPYPGYAQENKGPLILTATGTLTAIAGLFVSARIYSRMVSLGKLGVDDYIVILCSVSTRTAAFPNSQHLLPVPVLLIGPSFSQLLSVSYVALAAVAIKYGGGRHLATLPPEDIPKAIYYTVVSFVPGVTSFTIPKFAVVILLAKILDPGRWHRMSMWVISTSYLLLSAGMLVINFAQCSPASAQWNGPISQCWDRRITVDYAMALGICSVLFDFYLAIYPTIVLSMLQLNWKKKLALSSSLGFGYWYVP
jgi:hypothetical protein